MSRLSRVGTATGWEKGLADADLTLRLTDKVPMPFRRIPAGEFWMGARGKYPSDEPRHLVRITSPFFMATFPTTQHQYRAVVGRKRMDGLDPSPSDFKGDLRPVEAVSWDNVQRWFALLQQKPYLQIAEAKLGEGSLQVALPTEAQWEYACRAGTDTEYSTGDGEAPLDEAGWYGGNANRETHDVGLKIANGFGLYDMHGNVDEWCAGTYDEDAYKKRVSGVCDPLIDCKTNAFGVLRGGGWYSSPWECRAAYRHQMRYSNQFGSQGFRVCLFLGPCPGQAVGAEQASGGMATRDEAAKPQREREASDFFDDLGAARFPKQ